MLDVVTNNASYFRQFLHLDGLQVAAIGQKIEAAIEVPLHRSREESILWSTEGKNGLNIFASESEFVTGTRQFPHSQNTGQNPADAPRLVSRLA